MSGRIASFRRYQSGNDSPLWGWRLSVLNICFGRLPLGSHTLDITYGFHAIQRPDGSRRWFPSVLHFDTCSKRPPPPEPGIKHYPRQRQIGPVFVAWGGS